MLHDARIDATIPVVDLKRARRFYRDTLMLEEIVPSDMDPKVTEDNAMFRVGDCTRFLLFRRPHASKAEHTVAGFTVRDLKKTMEELNERGVRFERYNLPNLKTDERGLAEQNGIKAAWFKDSEGNILGISELISFS